MTDPSQLSAVTSQSLLEHVRRRSPEAWDRLSVIYGPLVYQWARRCRLSNEDAADVVQEVFRALTHALIDFHGVGKFRGRLWTVTRNKVRDQLRAAERRAVATGGTTAYGLLQQLADDAPEPWSTDDERSASEHGVALRTLDLFRAEFEPTTWQAASSWSSSRRSGSPPAFPSLSRARPAYRRRTDLAFAIARRPARTPTRRRTAARPPPMGFRRGSGKVTVALRHVPILAAG